MAVMRIKIWATANSAPPSVQNKAAKRSLTEVHNVRNGSKAVIGPKTYPPTEPLDAEKPGGTSVTAGLLSKPLLLRSASI